MTLTTIKKTAPLALLAVVMSSAAFAGKGENNGKGRKGQPQGSISVVTTCSLCGDPSDPAFDPAKYVDCNYSTTNPPLYVAAEITDETGDVYDPVELGIQVDANVQRKDGGGKNAWIGIPDPDSTGATPAGPGTWTTILYPCKVDPSIGGAKAISALVNVEITQIDASKEVYSSQCENIDADDPATTDINESETSEDEDGIDQSNFNVRELGITC